MHERAREFRERAREEYDFDVEVREFPEGTKTAADAADAIGCDVARIASSIAMVAGDELVVVVTSGANRVSEARLADVRGVPEAAVRTANADEIEDALGWSIGGVPPFCHDADAPVLFDADLGDFDTVWAAAGTPSAVFPVSPDAVRKHADAETVDVSG